MSIKDLFEKGYVSKVVSSKSLDKLGKDAESAGNIIAATDKFQEFEPPIDFSSASNFAVYGSAEKYYESAVKRIYQQYPYDGSEKEMNEYALSSSYLDRYILEKEYPRSTGYVLLSADGWGTVASTAGVYGLPATPEYILLKGGPHTNLTRTDAFADGYSGSHPQDNVFDLAKDRGSNLALNPASGSTVEFWMKKEAFATTKTTSEVIFDVWNNSTFPAGDYGRLRVEMRSATPPFRVTYASGTTPVGFVGQSIGSSTTTAASVADGNWHHYAFTFLSESAAGFVAKLYIDGELDDTKTYTTAYVNELTGAMEATIGAVRTATVAAATSLGGGKLSASLDEFRYWKAARTAEEVGKNWWHQVRGGTNTDDANTSLGVYYKFNEGITTDSDLDSTVLDYSGRVSNGAWTGYGTNSRNTGSAMVSSSASPFEFEDPIIYSTHPSVKATLTALTQTGSVYDVTNNASLYNSLPDWIIREDRGDLKNLTQIMASYFDKLHNQIKAVPDLKNVQYLSSSDKQYPFSSKLLDSSGLVASDVFVDADIMEQIMSRDDDRPYVLDLDEIKNRIYQNIYNNLVYINKSKGTEKAFRNLIHCYGVGEDLIRLNTYGNNVTYELKDNFRTSVLARNVVSFYSPEGDNRTATVFQMTASSNVNSVSFISGTSGSLGNQGEDYLGFTLESEMMFPRYIGTCETTGSCTASPTTASLFGMHAAVPEVAAYDTRIPNPDVADLRIQACRPDVDSHDVKFRILSSIAGMPDLTSSLFKNVYDDTKWNLAVRVVNEKYPLGDFVNAVSASGSSYAATPFRLEFYGASYELDVLKEEFYLTSSIANATGENMLRSPKRVFAGANRTNFSGAVLQQSDIKLASVKYWADYIPDETIRAHAKNSETYGPLRPMRNAFLTQNALTGTYVPEAATLALNWNFYDVTGSNEHGEFEVQDYSSGSVALQDRYYWYGKIVDAQHSAIGFGFPTSNNRVVDKVYTPIAKQALPEVINSSEMVNILTNDDINFTRDSRPINYYFSVEKSMYQVISDEIVNAFAKILEFNNLIGDRQNRYRQDYKLMEKARNFFFEGIDNTPDLDKFVEFYKWIDSSLNIFLQQLVPASADSSDTIRTLVESHILERNKYWSKFPTLDTNVPGGESGLEGTAENPATLGGFPMTAPSPYEQPQHSSYWRFRASRLESPLASGDAGVDGDRQVLLDSITSTMPVDRQVPVVLEADLLQQRKSPRQQLFGGINYAAAKERSIVLRATEPHGPIAASGTPLNAMLIDNLDVIDFPNITSSIPPEKDKRFYSFKVSIRREDETGVSSTSNGTYTSAMKGTIGAPFNIVSGTVTSDYNNAIVSNFLSGVILTNLHSDTFITNEIPIQGPFTNAHVGGQESRHVNINRYNSSKTGPGNLDDDDNRPEAWRIFPGTKYGSDATFIGIVGPDYPYPVGPYPYTPHPMAVRYRNVGTKRPVNIRNVQYSTSSVVAGNYQRTYEVVQTAGRTQNNKYFVDNDGVALPTSPLNLKGTLAGTTTLSTLLGLKHGFATPGNFFGVTPDPVSLAVSNRYEVLANFDSIIRTGSKTDSVFVNRFSAPGGPEVNTLIYMDLAAAEKSVYNALPFRNLSIRSSGSGESGTIRVQDQLNKRRGLRTLLALHAGAFGSDATFGSVPADTYVTQPSYQKNNRNPRKQIQFSGVTYYTDNNYVTGTVFDNANVTHAIPRSDLQYSWVTASYSVNKIYGHAWNDSTYSSSAGVVQSIQYITGSQITGAAGFFVDFAGLNTLIYDPIVLSERILSSSTTTYRNTSFATLARTEMLNGLNLHRNGPYQWPIWKQTRTGDTAVGRKLRETNTISYFERTSHPYSRNDLGDPGKPRFGTVATFTEAPIVTKYKPLLQALQARTLTPDNKLIITPMRIATSYGNSLAAFNNVKLNEDYNIGGLRPEAYDRIKDQYLNFREGDGDSPVSSFDFLQYRETVYPAATNMFSSSIRVRQEYSNNFWRSKRSDRTQAEVSDLLKLSNTKIKESMWSLDADETFSTYKQYETVNSDGAPGVLQNQYSQFHSGTINNITASVQYARRHGVDSIGSVSSPAGGISPTNVTRTTGFARFRSFTDHGPTPMDSTNGFKQLYAGQTLWEAGSQSERQPWYNNYDDYVSQMRVVGKDYSIVPSFRISETIPEYTKELKGDFFADNLNFLEMLGGTGDRNKSDEADFYKTYTNSDFLKFFEIVRSEHEGVATPSHITLQCKALKKFIPYDGFYPSERMVTLGQQFSSSYGAHVTSSGPDGVNKNVGFRAFMAPFFAPGIAFNTIKSGLAVDYPMFSASLGTMINKYKANPAYAGQVISGSGDKGLFHYRIPFEALVAPEQYISDKDMIDLEPHPSMSINVTASWGGGGNTLYKMMANNFWAEVPEFFLPQQQFTSLVSRPESSFGVTQNGEQFAARLKIYKSLNVPSFRTGALGYRNPLIPRDETDVTETFTMYSRPTAFGPPCGGGEFRHTLTSLDGINTPFTPPYYDGEAWADIIFTSPRSSTSDKPITLQEIFDPANLSVSYKRVGNEWPAMNINTIYHADNVEANSMQLDATLNIFGKAQIKNLSYDPATGQPTQAQDSDENVWVIQPKMETPMLNFSGASVTLPEFGSASCGIGMWHQYGSLPDDPSKGIFLEVADLPENYIVNALSGDPDLTGSLADLVGFKTEPVKLGNVASFKKVKEAVVAVPFIFKEGERRFFTLDRSLVTAAEQIVEFGTDSVTNGETPGDSIINMVKAMKQFVFPPKLDFLENAEAVEPFSMYVFEFEHTFDQEDLVNMWQNLLPKIGYAFDTDDASPPDTSQITSTVTIEHDLLINELLSGDLSNRVQWMVFKVKQRANKNYFSKVIDDEINQVGRFNRDVALQVGRNDSTKAFQPKYSYNWPYDFFSLVELVKLDAEVTLAKEEDS